MKWSQKCPQVNVRYSHCSNRCRVPVHCVSFSRSVRVSSNKVNVVVVLEKNKFKVFVTVTGKYKSKIAENVDASIEKACLIFGVTKLFLEKEKALKALIGQNDVLLNLPTGFGKSLVSRTGAVVET